MATYDRTKADDAPFTPGTDRVYPDGCMFDDSAPDSVDEGDVGVPRMSANRNQYVTIRDAAGNERGANVDASGNLQVAQSAHDSLNANANLQVANSDAPGGAGAVSSSTPRVTLASDDPAVSALQRRTDTVQQDTTITAATETTILNATASKFHDLYFLFISNRSTTFVYATLRNNSDADSPTIEIPIACPPEQAVGFVLPPQAGLKQDAANDPWTLQSSSAVTALEVIAMAVEHT